METLEIKKEDAVKAYGKASKQEKELLENLLGKKHFLNDAMERIKTMNDVLIELGEDDPDVIEYRKLMSANIADYIIGNQQAILLTKALNEGWKPDWDNTSEVKYCPWFKMSSSGFRYDGYDDWSSYSDVGSRLCFKSSKLAKYAGEKFTDVYQKFMTVK